MQEAQGWRRQGNGADSWNSVESASWKALREAEKTHRNEVTGEKLFLGVSGSVQSVLNPLKPARLVKRACIKRIHQRSG